ncbi:MAG: hypothetical protein ACPG77_14220 [Nannocystaceae bacterium]
MTSFAQIVAEQKRWGQATYRGWDPHAFDTLVESAATLLWDALGGDGCAPADALEAYLRLSQEALAVGVWSDPSAVGFFGRLWFRLVPKHAGSVPRVSLLRRLVELWNLGEGVHNEGRWLDLAVGQRMPPIEELSRVEPNLDQVLEELFRLGADPKWKRNPHRVLDLRPTCDRFLPGRMHQLAPRIVCVHDRREDDLCVGLSLAPGSSTLLGRIDCGPTFEDPRSAPEITLINQCVVKIGGKATLAPFLGNLHTSLTVPAGFVIVSASDSQRLWVLGNG